MIPRTNNTPATIVFDFIRIDTFQSTYMHKSSSTSEYAVLKDDVSLPIVLYPPHPRQGIEAAPNCPDYHMSLEASVPTNDTTK